MSFIEYKLPYIFNSNSSGVENKNFNGSSFEVILEQAIIIPNTAFYATLSVESATIWYVFYNIDEDNLLKVTYNDGSVEEETIEIDPGLYDLDHLNAEIQRKLSLTAIPSDLFQLVPSTADQKTVIQFNYVGARIDFTIDNSIREILGFNSTLVPLLETTAADQYEKSPNIATFNTLDYVLLHSDLVSMGIRINNKYDQTINQILIDNPPGSQIVSENRVVSEIPCNELIGQKRKRVRFWLTDQNGDSLDTRGESFSCRLTIHYFIKM